MKIIKPSVELLPVNHTIEQMWLNMERGARLCYASEPKEGSTWEDAKRFCLKHIKAGHVSIGRHGSVYLRIEDHVFAEEIYDRFKESPFVLMNYDDGNLYITTNYQFASENFGDEFIERYWCNMPIPENERYTFIVVTQISTSRELNRTSPNNIMEQSTRYVNFYSKGGAICQPWWFDLFIKDDEDIEVITLENNLYITIDGKTNPWYNTHCRILGPNIGYYYSTVERSLIKWYNDLKFYNSQIEHGMQSQDAREYLPLAIATKVAYSYNIKELIEIINKRYFGTTGKPHPNAKIIGRMFYNYVKRNPSVYNNIGEDDKVVSCQYSKDINPMYTKQG
jgi:hypothetical protein